MSKYSLLVSLHPVYCIDKLDGSDHEPLMADAKQSEHRYYFATL